jgi:hypothetical protein
MNDNFNHFTQEHIFNTKILEQSTYENQRWFPVVGWGSKMLPTDRFKFSSKDGKTELKKEDYILQNNEEIVCDWKINFENCDNEGWEYAIDFPATYSPENTSLCYVRRKKWIRTIKIYEQKNNDDNQFDIIGIHPNENNNNHLENKKIDEKKDTMFDPKYEICFNCAKKGHHTKDCTEIEINY